MTVETIMKSQKKLTILTKHYFKRDFFISIGLDLSSLKRKCFASTRLKLEKSVFVRVYIVVYVKACVNIRIIVIVDEIA